MTFGEIDRAVSSRSRVIKLEQQNRANFDYTQATLIIKGVGLVLGSKEQFPGIEEAYPGIFDNIVEEKQQKLQEKRDELSVLRFKQFAQSYNNKYIGGAK